MYKIMIIEDDVKIREELSDFLDKNGYHSIGCVTFDRVVDEVLQEEPHIVLLDLSLPVNDGYYICREVRKQSDVPIIVVTSRDNEIDELKSINLGADDFVSKPYNLQILLARIERIVKRVYEKQQDNVLKLDDAILDLSKSVLLYKEEAIELTKNEFRILCCLFTSKNKIVSREALMKYMWDSDLFLDDNTLAVNITRLRKKLEYYHLEDMIETKRGEGYIVYEKA